LLTACDRKADPGPIVAEVRSASPSAPAPPGAVAVPARDPANIEGTWPYRTESNCGKVPGVGEVSFAWDAETGKYAEKGYVYWADSKVTIRWWGDAGFDPRTRTLDVHTKNSLGDTVEGRWELEGAGPDRLVVRWSQTNGCKGLGVATRAAAPRPSP
jgi:hypothetical protein